VIQTRHLEQYRARVGRRTGPIEIIPNMVFGMRLIRSHSPFFVTCPLERPWLPPLALAAQGKPGTRGRAGFLAARRARCTQLGFMATAGRLRREGRCRSHVASDLFSGRSSRQRSSAIRYVPPPQS
jgi:hypothetical protein